jgi:hypothetical protein
VAIHHCERSEAIKQHAVFFLKILNFKLRQNNLRKPNQINYITFIGKFHGLPRHFVSRNDVVGMDCHAAKPLAMMEYLRQYMIESIEHFVLLDWHVNFLR